MTQQIIDNMTNCMKSLSLSCDHGSGLRRDEQYVRMPVLAGPHAGDRPLRHID